MSDQWLCYGDYVCLSTRAGRDTTERKYILGHSSPLMQLQKVQPSNSDFASIVLAENPATIAFSKNSSADSIDMITNAREYWFQLLPRTDYDMSAQLSAFKRQHNESSKKLQQLQSQKAELSKKKESNQVHVANSTLSTSSIALNRGLDIDMSSKPPTEAAVQVGDDAAVEMQPMGSSNPPNVASPEEVRVTVGQTAASSVAMVSSGLAKFVGNITRRQSISSGVDAKATDIDSKISQLQTEIANLVKRIAEYRVKTAQERNGNLETIARMHGDPLVYGAVIQLSHVTSKRLLTVNKTQDRPVELAALGRPGSLFYIERVSTGVAGGSAKIPADENISVRLRAFISDSQYLRMEPNISLVPGTKFGVSLDVELDGVFNVDASFQLGTGAASNDNRIDWIMERCKKNSHSSDASNADDAAEEEGVDVHEVLSGCQIIRLYHRASESYLAAAATKMDRGKVFYVHRLESDPAQGIGKISNTYWMVIDGDGDMADSGEDVDSDSPVILQHVVSGMVLVGIRHVPATESLKATNDEAYLSDEDDSEIAANDETEQQIIKKRDKLDKWIQTIKESVNAVLDYCSQKIVPGYDNLAIFCSNDIMEEFSRSEFHSAGVKRTSEDESVSKSVENDIAEYNEYTKLHCNDTSDFTLVSLHKYQEQKGLCSVDFWIKRGESLLKFLKDTVAFLSRIDDLTIENITIKALEIEYELQAWFNMPVCYRHVQDLFIFARAIEVIDYALANYKKGDFDDSASHASGMTSLTAGGKSALTQKEPPSSVASERRSTMAMENAGTDIVSVSGTHAEETQSQILKDKRKMHPLEIMRKIIEKFKQRDKKEKTTLGHENVWTFHVMTPKRIANFRANFLDQDLNEMEEKSTSRFLLSCRWSLSTRHEKSRRKEDTINVSNNTLFGIEVVDCKDSIFLLGTEDSISRSDSKSSKVGRVSMASIGHIPDKKGFEPLPQQQFERHLHNLEFVSPKNADQIRNGAQVSSIIRNFCSQLKQSSAGSPTEMVTSYNGKTPKEREVRRDLSDNDLDYYISFLRRYHSRLTEAFDVVARSCVVDGFQKGVQSDEIDSQGQMFFGSLGVVELTFSVIQPLTEQLGWQIDEAPPFFTHWQIRHHHAPILHQILSAISGSSTIFPKNRADEFFKRWRQRKTTDNLPWGDAQLDDANHEILEEMGFPPLIEAGKEVPRVAHSIFKLFVESRRLKLKSWSKSCSELKIPQGMEGAGNSASPETYSEAMMKRNFPNLEGTNMMAKKVQAVARAFDRAFASQDDEDAMDEESAAYSQNGQLMECLQYAMKPSDFDFYIKKYVEKFNLYTFKALVSPVQASRIRIAAKHHQVQIDVSAGEQTFYLSKNSGLFFVSFEQIFSEDFRSSFEEQLSKSKVIEFENEKQHLNAATADQIDYYFLRLILDSQKHLAKILKEVALDVDNSDSPWNDLPIFFNFKDTTKFSDLRAILIDIVRRACACVSKLTIGCQKNAKKITSSQIFYVIKNLLPRSSSNQLNIASLLSSLLKGNFSAIDRMFTDAAYSSLLQNMNDLRTSGVVQVFQSLVLNHDGSPDYAQQMRVLKYAFQTPYNEGRVLVPRIGATYLGGIFESLRLVFDSTYALDKLKQKPSPKDHPFAYINPPLWAKTAENEKRSYIEPWDVLVPVTRRTGTLGKLYGEWNLPKYFELKLFARDNDVIEDFGYFSEVKKIEQHWNAVHDSKNSIGDSSIVEIERNLKRDFWYCIMKVHLQFLCASYSLAATLCANRNQQAWNFFFGKQKQVKDQFWVQTWGTRPSTSIISDETDDQGNSTTCCTYVNFGVDGFSTVAAVTNNKPMNPSCGYQVPFITRRFMYYEVTIESFANQQEDKAMLQLGWTVAGKERNADQPSDGDGVGDFTSSWGFDGIRTITYQKANDLLNDYEKAITDAQESLARHMTLPQHIVNVHVRDLRDESMQSYMDEISSLWDQHVKGTRDEAIDDEKIINQTKEVESAKFMLRSRIPSRRSLIAHMHAAKLQWEAKKNGELKNVLVDRGLIGFHWRGSDAGADTLYSSYLNEKMTAELMSGQKKSFRWGKQSTIGVWYDMTAKEMGIIRSEAHGGKQTLFRRSDTAFYEDLNSISWTEDDIVPCISGKGVNIKINLGILEGEMNSFTYFNSSHLCFKDTSASNLNLPVEPIQFKGGKIVTLGPHNLANDDFVRFEFPRTPITPSRKTSGDQSDDLYEYRSHGLYHNQIIMFSSQRVLSCGIATDRAYVVENKDGNPDQFSLRAIKLKEQVPYRVKIDKESPNAFDVSSNGNPDGVYISDPLQLPRVYLNGKATRAVWGPYGESTVDVTDLYNRLYEKDGLRSIGNSEAVYVSGKTERIMNNLKHFFKPELVSIHAIQHADRANVYIYDNHGLSKNQLVQFVKQDQKNGIQQDKAYVVDLENGTERFQFRLVPFSQHETCFLTVYESLNLPDIDIGTTGSNNYDALGKLIRAPQKSLKFYKCLPYQPPSKVTSQEIPNFAFSNGMPVLPGYEKACDIIFSSFLPACLRSSCVEVLRSCFIDQEPWFLTPPINTIRAISDEPAVSPIQNPGGYPASFRDICSWNRPNDRYKLGRELPELGKGYHAYDESDMTFFKDLFHCAGFEQSQQKNPVYFGNKNWNDGSEHNPGPYRVAKDFLLKKFKRPSAKFELCTRDIAIFWGRASVLLWEHGLKSKFISEKNQDVKIFLKNLVYCLLDTLRFQFDESWTGIIEVRSMVVKDFELCALSYFSQVDVAQNVADIIVSQQKVSPSSDSASAAAAQDSRASKLLSCFRRRESLSSGGAVGSAPSDEQSSDLQYKSIIPELILSGVKYVEDSAWADSQSYTQYCKSQRYEQPYGYFKWPEGKQNILADSASASASAESRESRSLSCFRRSESTAQTHNVGKYSFTHDQLKGIFQQSSGDLLLSLCELLSVSWQVMVDDRISDFVERCVEWSAGSKQRPTSGRSANLRELEAAAEQRKSVLTKKALKDFFEKEKANESKLPCEDYVDENGFLHPNQIIDWFDVLPSLASIPKTANMASKLCVQLHSFPKDVFQSLKETKILTGQESQVICNLEIELRTLRSLKEEVRLCFFFQDDLLALRNIPNDVSFNLGESWKCIERLIAQLCFEKEYEESLAEVQSWVSPSAARLFVPNNEGDKNYEELYEIVDNSGGLPPWDESLEYIEMLHDALHESRESANNWYYDKTKSPYFIIKPQIEAIHDRSWKTEMKVFSKDQIKPDIGEQRDLDTSPSQVEFHCYICSEAGSGYCFCFCDEGHMEYVHPGCVYNYRLASVKRFQADPTPIPTHIEQQFRTLYDSNKADQDATWSNERRTLVIEEIKKGLQNGSENVQYLDSITKPEGASESSVLKPEMKRKQIQKALLQIGIIDQLVDIAKIKFPKKFSQEQADQYNQKMQNRMNARRINYSFESVNATFARVTIVECLMRRVFFLLSRAALNCKAVQDRLYKDIDFFFSKALEPTANDSALCIFSMIQGNLDNATSVPVDLLVKMAKVAQDGQNPDDILLLVPFMAQGDKNISVNQREILELCMPTELAIQENCMFVLDSDYPSESSDKSSFETWKSRIVSLHVPANKRLYGENPWDVKDHNWKHLMRVASDIVHGGYASKSEPCRSAFHMAFIQTVIACGYNNSEERQNITSRLPFAHVLHILNTVCSTLNYRVWGHSFIERAKLSVDDEVKALGSTVFHSDPRLNFLNFDQILTSKNAYKTPVPTSALPLCGLLKFIKSYLDLVSQIHFFNDSSSEDVVRRTSEGLPLTTFLGAHGFITWMGVIIKQVVQLFPPIMQSTPAGALNVSVTPDAAAGVLSVADTSDKVIGHSSQNQDLPFGSEVLSTFGPSEPGTAPETKSNSKPISMGLMAKLKAKAHSYIGYRPFEDFNAEWYQNNGDISVADFENEMYHPLISVVLNQMWSKIFGLGVVFETPLMQGLKMADKIAYDARENDIHYSKPKFCRPYWRCPISHAHFTNENYSVLALAISCILFDQVPMEWKAPNSGKESIMGALKQEPIGYGENSSKRPNVSDVAEARLFILAIELLIQEMVADPALRWDPKTVSSDETSVLAQSCELESAHKSQLDISPLEVLQMLTEDFDRVLKTRSFAGRAEFQKHLYKDVSRPDGSWPQKLSQSSNETSAIVLIEKKITQWNIIRIFRAPSPDNPIYGQISVTQAPIVRRCLSFALVYNWGAWGGLGSEVSLKQMKLIVDSIGATLSDICQISTDTLPSFIQQLFHKYEAPKAGSLQAKEYDELGTQFQNLVLVLQQQKSGPNETDFMKVVSRKLSESTGTFSTPLEYIAHVGEMLKKPPKNWSAIETFSKAVQKATVHDDLTGMDDGKNAPAQSISVGTVSIVQAYESFLSNEKIKKVVSDTIDLNAEDLMYRFLAIDTQDRLNPVDPDDMPFSFYSKSHLLNSTDRDAFPKYLNKMVYNILNVLNSFQTMNRGEDTNWFISTCLRTLTQVIFCGSCVNSDEAGKQFGKLARNKLVLDVHDSQSFFARVRHLQECLVGLRWLSKDEIDAEKSKAPQKGEGFHNPTVVTDASSKIALKSFSAIARLATPAGPSNEIREKAMHALSCLLDNCSTAVLDRLFDPKEAQVIHSTSNLFARSLQQSIKNYEDFVDRDDELTIYLGKFRRNKQNSSSSTTEDDFIRKLIEFETTDWLGDDLQPDPDIKAAYESFCSKNFTMCLYGLRLISQMCVQSGQTTRASYAVGQKYMLNQPNSDPALVVDFSSVLNSLGSAIASRMRLAQANVFDIRILCRLFKAFNAIIFGAPSEETRGYLVADTFVLINKTVSGLSQRIDDYSSPFFPGNHPINVLEQMMTFLLSFALSDIDGSCCKQLGKSISWINFFNVIHQVHVAASKLKVEESSIVLKPQVITPSQYREAATHVCDSAYILYSAVKRRDIFKSAQLEKDWRHANLDPIASDAKRRVSCVEIVRTPGFAELCFFTNPDDLQEVGDNTQRQLLCLEDSRQLSLRKNLVICEQLRTRKTVTGSGIAATLFKFMRNIPLVLTTLINLLLLGWLNLPIEFGSADGWKWPQDQFLWERLVPNITSEDGSYSYEDFQNEVLPNVLPLFINDETPEDVAYRNGINMTFLVLAGANIVVCLVNLIGYMVKKAKIDIYEHLLTSAYNEMTQSKKKQNLEDLQKSSESSSYVMILKMPSFWGRLIMFVCSLCILFISPLFSVLFVCDGFRFPGISYIFGAFTAKYKEFMTLGYLTASIIFMNAVIGLVFFWDLFAAGGNEAGASECTTLFQCTLSFVVLGWQGGGLSDLLSAAKDTPQGTPTKIGDPNPSSYRLIIVLFWQLLYFVVVPTCLVSTVVGIISDSFGDARQKKAEWKDTMSQECFVCGKTAADFRDAGLLAGLPEESIVTFEEHVNTEHCVKDYFKLFTGVKGGKNPDLLTAQEHFVLQKINSLDESFFPMELSISLDAMKSFAESESSSAEKQEKRLDGFQGELAKVGETVKHVQNKLETMITQEDLNRAKHEQIAKMDELIRLFNAQTYAMNEQLL